MFLSVLTPIAFVSHPLMLGWGAAIMAPLIIHLLSKRKYREMQWAAMQYLLAAMRKNSRRILLEQWILLAVRMLIVALVVLALAEPGCQQAALRLRSGDRAHKMIVIDGSYSMAYQPSDKSRFEQAKQLAERIVRESVQGDGFTLVLLGSPPRVVVGTPAFEPLDFRAEIENLRLPHGGADLVATLAKVEELLQAARLEQPRLLREEVYILSDLGRNTWAVDLAQPSGQAFLDRAKRLSQQASLAVIDLGQDDTENGAITRVATVDPFATTARDVTIEADVRNFGRQAKPRQLVELFVDNRRVGEDHVDLDPGGQATALFEYRFDTPGDRVVEVRLANDLLSIDNHRWLSVGVKEQLRVLCVNGQPASAARRSGTEYLALALSPASDQNDRSIVRVDVVLESALVESDLSAYDAVFLVNVAQFTQTEGGVLASYLKRGGGLVVFLGDQVQSESYNRVLGNQAMSGERLLPVTLGAVAAAGQYQFNPLEYRHPIVEPFRNQEQAGLITTPIQRYVQLDTTGHDRAQVVLAFDSGESAVVEAPVHRGRVIVCATSADTSWTAMPVWPSYLPIVQEMLAWVVRGQAQDHNVLVGSPLGSNSRELVNQSTVVIRTPNDESSTVRVASGSDDSGWSFADTLTSGVYQASYSSPTTRVDSFAVNVDTSESDLSRIEADELKQHVWPGVSYLLRTDWQDLANNDDEALIRRRTFHEWLLATAVVLLLFESSLASYWGRRSS